MNLALTLELAGRVDEALASYGSALEVYPDYLPALQGIARLTLKSGRNDERLTAWLETIAMRGSSVRWTEWAKRQSSRIAP